MRAKLDKDEGGEESLVFLGSTETREELLSFGGSNATDILLSSGDSSKVACQDRCIS